MLTYRNRERERLLEVAVGGGLKEGMGQCAATEALPELA
jgi:hypothetical protein